MFWQRQILSFGVFLSVGLLCHLSYAIGDKAEFIQASSGEFERPHDLVLGPENKYLYVADLGNHAVKVLNPYTLKTLGVIGKGILRAPHDVAFDRWGQLLVADTGNDRVVIYKVNGADAKFKTEIRNGLRSPEGVTSSPTGILYVSNAGSHNVVAFKDGMQIDEYGLTVTGNDRFVRPHDIQYVHPDKIYVSDPGNNRIQILNESLDVIEMFTGDNNDFNEPKYFGTGEGDRYGNWLYVADQYNHQVKVFNESRKMIAKIGSGKAGKKLDQLNGPEGVEARLGYIWVSDTHNDRILMYKWMLLEP